MFKLICKMLRHSWVYGQWWSPVVEPADPCWYRSQKCSRCGAEIKYHVLKGIDLAKPLDVVHSR